MDALSYYALEDFGVRHKHKPLAVKLGLTVTRLPSDTTFRRILQRKRFSFARAAVPAMGQLLYRYQAQRVGAD